MEFDKLDSRPESHGIVVKVMENGMSTKILL